MASGFAIFARHLEILHQTIADFAQGDCVPESIPDRRARPVETVVGATRGACGGYSGEQHITLIGHGMDLITGDGFSRNQ